MQPFSMSLVVAVKGREYHRSSSAPPTKSMAAATGLYSGLIATWDLRMQGGTQPTPPAQGGVMGGGGGVAAKAFQQQANAAVDVVPNAILQMG